MRWSTFEILSLISVCLRQLFLNQVCIFFKASCLVCVVLVTAACMFWCFSNILTDVFLFWGFRLFPIIVCCCICNCKLICCYVSSCVQVLCISLVSCLFGANLFFHVSLLLSLFSCVSSVILMWCHLCCVTRCHRLLRSRVWAMRIVLVVVVLVVVVHVLGIVVGVGVSWRILQMRNDTTLFVHCTFCFQIMMLACCLLFCVHRVVWQTSCFYIVCSPSCVLLFCMSLWFLRSWVDHAFELHCYSSDRATLSWVELSWVALSWVGGCVLGFLFWGTPKLIDDCAWNMLLLNIYWNMLFSRLWPQQNN